MKVLIAAAATAVLIALPAGAQTTTTTPTPPVSAPASASHCPAPPANPTLPDGATVAPDVMQAANTEFTAWATSTRAALECRRAEAQELQAAAAARASEYNEAARVMNATITQWETEVAEYNTAHPARQSPPRRGH